MRLLQVKLVGRRDARRSPARRELIDVAAQPVEAGGRRVDHADARPFADRVKRSKRSSSMLLVDRERRSVDEGEQQLAVAAAEQTV